VCGETRDTIRIPPQPRGDELFFSEKNYSTVRVIFSGWLPQRETLRHWHQRASIDRRAERCTAAACRSCRPFAAVDSDVLMS